MPPWQASPPEPEPGAPAAIAIAGAGRIASIHALSAKALGVDVSHVASRTSSNASRLAEGLGAVACSYDELPEAGGLVVVATPPACHLAHAVAALGAGASVLLEKPMCTTLREADALVEVAESSAGTLIYGENLAFAPSVRQALVEVSHMGPLRHLEVRAVQERPDWGDFLTPGWGGGSLFDLGAHPVALCLLAALPLRPVFVSARVEGGGDHDTDEWAELRIGFDGGLVARVVASWRDRGGSWDLQAASDDGVVRLEILPTLGLERDGEALTLPPPRPGLELDLLEELGYLGEMEAALGRSTPSLPPLPRSGDKGSALMDASFGRDVLDLICGAYRSAGRGGAREALPFEGPRDLTPLQLWRSG